MLKTFQAVYENGALHPIEPLILPEKKLVTVTIEEDATASGVGSDSLSDEDFDRLLEELASGPDVPPPYRFFPKRYLHGP